MNSYMDGVSSILLKCKELSINCAHAVSLCYHCDVHEKCTRVTPLLHQNIPMLTYH
jgi:hypothetical protein